MSPNTPERLFVVGTGRTGSKIYLHIVRTSDSHHLSHELKFRRWFQPDVVGLYEDHGRPVGREEARPFVGELVGRRIKGRFWEALDEEGGARLEEDLLERFDESEGVEEGDLLEWIVDIDAEHHGKEVGGAKFPVHLRYASLLPEWFPTCRVVHLTRDPRAAASSHLEAQLPRIEELVPFPVPNPIGRSFLFAQKIYEYRLAARFHETNREKDWYKLVRFEDLVRQPRETIEDLCDFVGMGFREEMLEPPMVASSYEEGERGIGFDESALDRWREHLSSTHRWLIETTTARAARVLGYPL